MKKIASLCFSFGLLSLSALAHAQGFSGGFGLNIIPECGGCQTQEQFPNAMRAFAEAFNKQASKHGLNTGSAEFVVRYFRARGLGGRLASGATGKDEMTVEMRVGGQVFTATDAAWTPFTGYEGVAENVAEQLADYWITRRGSINTTNSATTSSTGGNSGQPYQANNYQTTTSNTGNSYGSGSYGYNAGTARNLTQDQMNMARTMGLRVD